jgi:uncharacterized protein (DUF433 family)
MRHERIVIDPNLMAGKPCIRGTRIPVEQILYELGDQVSVQAVLRLHPNLTARDVEAAVHYAADMLRHGWLRSKTIMVSEADDNIPR